MRYKPDAAAVAAIKGRNACILAGGLTEAQKGNQVVRQNFPVARTLSQTVRDNGLKALQVQKKFILALVFSFAFMIVEVVGGYFANR